MAQARAPAVSYEKQLARFLHYGCVTGTYTPGSRLHGRHFAEHNIYALRVVLKNICAEHAFDIIEKVFHERSSPHPEMIAFVLAECARLESLRYTALRVAVMLCEDTKLFLLFFKFSREIHPKIGVGPMYKRFLSIYYLEKDVTELANEVVKYPSFKGWGHGDIFRMTHMRPRPEDIARQAVFAYICEGPRHMNAVYLQEPEARAVTNFINRLEALRKERNPLRAIKLIQDYMLPVEFVNADLLKNEEVWQALLHYIPLARLLDHFSLMTRNGLLQNNREPKDDDFISCFQKALKNERAINQSGLHPSRVYIKNISYQNEAIFKLNIASARDGAEYRNPPTLSNRIISSLDQLTEATFKTLQPNCQNYLISVDPYNFSSRTVGYLPFMTPSQAAAITVKTYLKVEPYVTVVVPVWNDRYRRVIIGRSASTVDIDDYFSSLAVPPLIHSCGIVSHSTSMLKLFEWAQARHMAYDVFILVGVAINAPKIVAKFTEYKTEMRLPWAKLILLNLCITESTVDRDDVFVISGFDEKVITLMVAFVNGWI